MTMTRRELNLAIFEGATDKILWQPRLETWLEHHRREGTFPARFRDKTDLEIYDALGCSVRYAACYGIESYEDPADVERSERREGGKLIQTLRTPSGEITTVLDEVWEGDRLANQRIREFPVKTVEGLRVVTDLVERQQFRANHELFASKAEQVGHRGEPTIFLTSSGYTELIKVYCGLIDTTYLMYDHPKELEIYLEACDRRDDRMIDAALELPCRIFNLGDHATNEFTPPPILTKYLMPRWQRIARRMTENGRFVHTHWDGHSNLMLPYLLDTNLHGVEALTPRPMGDMTLEEIKAAVKDQMVVLDLLPAIHFLDQYTTETVVEFAKRAIDMFAPKLILGISDEISQVGQIEKVEAITALVDKTCGLAT
ncbi:MAG: hypothetical protein JXQ73_04235 [Phycisphaerae bacterium]|nr:hypothetical protein [Phycisphaerae bacterium]